MNRDRLRRALARHLLTHYEPCSDMCADEIANEYAMDGTVRVPLDPPFEQYHAVIHPQRRTPRRS